MSRNNDGGQILVTTQKLYWVERIASLILIFCLGLIAGNVWENPPFIIIACIMMAACIAKIWTCLAVKKSNHQR